MDGKCLQIDGRGRVGVACCDVGDDGRGLEARFPARDATTPKNMTARAASMQVNGTGHAMIWSGCASLHTHGTAETPPQQEREGEAHTKLSLSRDCPSVAPEICAAAQSRRMRRARRLPVLVGNITRQTRPSPRCTSARTR